MLVPKKEKIICADCKKAIHGARTVIHEQWHCSDCTYRHDYPEAAIPPKQPRSRVRANNPTLFEVDGYLRHVDRG